MIPLNRPRDNRTHLFGRPKTTGIAWRTSVFDDGGFAQAPGAAAESSAASSSADSASVAARIRLSTCAGVVALAIGAVTPGCAITQASATSADLALWREATDASASTMRRPRGLRY